MKTIFDNNYLDKQPNKPETFTHELSYNPSNMSTHGDTVTIKLDEKDNDYFYKSSKYETRKIHIKIKFLGYSKNKKTYKATIIAKNKAFDYKGSINYILNEMQTFLYGAFQKEFYIKYY